MAPRSSPAAWRRRRRERTPARASMTPRGIPGQPWPPPFRFLLDPGSPAAPQSSPSSRGADRRPTERGRIRWRDRREARPLDPSRPGQPHRPVRRVRGKRNRVGTGARVLNTGPRGARPPGLGAEHLCVWVRGIDGQSGCRGWRGPEHRVDQRRGIRGQSAVAREGCRGGPSWRTRFRRHLSRSVRLHPAGGGDSASRGCVSVVELREGDCCDQLSRLQFHTDR